MLAEAIGGWLANSLALLADATHMLTDVAALALSIFAARLARRPPNPTKTYGYYRAEILAALLNGAAVVALSLFIFVHAYQRFRQPAEVQGQIVLWIAAGGLVINLLAMWVLRGGRSQNLNVRGAWLHVVGDALGSVGALLAGLLIWTLGWHWVDPLVSVLIALLVLRAACQLLSEAVAVLMEGLPRGMDVNAIRAEMLAVPGVAEAHDLHVWSITTGMNSLSAHVVPSTDTPRDELLQSLRQSLHERFRIEHVTLQIEPSHLTEHALHT